MVYRDAHWTRVVMDAETRSIIGGLCPETLETLEISGKKWGKEISFKSYESVHYPAFDLCASTLEKSYDLIIAEQVFEHLLWPYRACRNVCKMLKPKGYFLITTPFLLRIHDGPHDCTRWTETGIKYFLAEGGFNIEQIKTGTWGNRACVRANLSNWAKYNPLLHSLKNEPDCPVVVWALARK